MPLLATRGYYLKDEKAERIAAVKGVYYYRIRENTGCVPAMYRLTHIPFSV